MLLEEAVDVIVEYVSEIRKDQPKAWKELVSEVMDLVEDGILGEKASEPTAREMYAKYV